VNRTTKQQFSLALDEAFRSLVVHPQHHLSLPLRTNVLKGFGPIHPPGESWEDRPKNPQRMRAMLNIACVEWMRRQQPVSEENARVDEALHVAKMHLEAGGNWQACRAIGYDLQSRIQGYPEQGPGCESGMYLLQATSAAVSVAMGDCGQFFVPGIEDEGLDVWDAGMYASWVAAGGATWDLGRGDHEARHTFWQWYLTEAAKIYARDSQSE
jgi:hypothetical protein